MWRLVQNLPSFPKKGESLMVKSMLMVGSSMLMGGRASGFSKSQMVSPISKFSSPMMAQMSPLDTSWIFCLPMPVKVCSSFILVFSFSPLRCTMVTFMPSLRVPRCTRPTAMRPV